MSLDIAEIFGKATPLGAAIAIDDLAAAGDGASGAGFLVDGVAISASRSGENLQLTCTLAERIPDDERELRRLLSQFLFYSDRGHAVMYCDGRNRLLLTDEIEPSGNARGIAADFFDAAVHWSRILGARASGSEPNDLRAPIIFP